MKHTLFLAALLLAFSPLAQAKPNNGNVETNTQTDKKAEKDAKKAEKDAKKPGIPHILSIPPSRHLQKSIGGKKKTGNR